MSMNLSCKLDDLQRGDRHMETSVALCEIRTQLQELTKSVESCQSEVSEVSSAKKGPVLPLAMGHHLACMLPMMAMATCYKDNLFYNSFLCRCKGQKGYGYD